MRAVDSKDRWPELVVTVGGLGYLPVAPGTWGTLGGAAIHALVAWQIGTAALAGTAARAYLLPALAALFTLACIVYGPWAERFYGRRDPKPFVIDEVAGYLLAVSFFPSRPQVWVGVFAFVFFRVFDIAKPFPIHRAERAPAGFGIVLDDLIAGVYAAFGTWLILTILSL